MAAAPAPGGGSGLLERYDERLASAACAHFASSLNNLFDGEKRAKAIEYQSFGRTNGDTFRNSTHRVPWSCLVVMDQKIFSVMPL
jgi:hypothetical protein